MKRRALVLILLLGLTAPASADVIPAALDGALEQVGSREDQHWKGTVERKRTRSTGMMVTNGAPFGEPYTGGLEVHRHGSGTLILSSDPLPGFALLATGERTVKLATYEEEPLQLADLASDVPPILDFPAVRKLDADWQVTAGSDGTSISVVLPSDSISPPQPRRHRGMGLNLPQAKILEIRVEYRLNADGHLARVAFEVDRSNPMAAMLGMVGGQRGSDTVDNTHVITLEPTAGPLSPRGKLVEAQLIAALAAPAPSVKPVTERPRRPGRDPRPTPVPASARERFAQTIEKYDTDEDGKLSIEEVGERWSKLGKYDTNGDNAVDIEELIAGYQRTKESARRPGSAGR